MKTFITIIISLVFVIPCFSQQNLIPAYPEEITYRGDVAYFHDSPFTGLLVDKKTNQQLGEFMNGYKNGTFREYYPSGKKKYEAEYSDGIQNGKYNEWYLNGQIKVSYNYNNGNIADGKYDTYIENGLIEKEETFENGQIISTGKYKEGKLTELTELYVEFYPNSRKKSEGYLKNSKKDSVWTYWYDSGQKKSEGQFLNDKMEGQWVIWFEDGKKEFEGNYADGKKDGQGIMHNKIGFYNGSFKEDKRNGQGKIIYWNKDTYEGEWKNDTMSGYGTYNWVSGNKYVGDWVGAQMNGHGTFTSKVYSYTGYFKNGQFDGKGVEIYNAKGGAVITQSGIFKSHKLINGSFTQVLPNGKKSIREIRNGKKLRLKKQE